MSENLIIRACSDRGFHPISARFSGTDSIPRRRYIKDLVRAGTYVKNNRSITVTDEMMKNWVDQFMAMSADGVKVPVVSSHDEAKTSDGSRGWVTDLYIEGDTLWFACELIGQDAIVAAERNDVSLGSPPVLRDKYPQPIAHVALCSDPVVTGLGEFIPLEMSQKLNLRMNMGSALGTLLAAMGIADAPTDENAETLVAQAIKGMKKVETSTSTSTYTTETEIKPTGQEVAMSQNTEPKNETTKPDERLVKTIGQLRTAKLDMLFSGSHITAAVKDKITKRFATVEAIELSLSSSSNDDDVFDFIVAVLKENKPVKTGEKTGAQAKTVELSSGVGSDEGSNALIEAMDRLK